jgi:hypothetical protein
MQLAERHIIKSTEYRFPEIDEVAFKSKNLYNAANYVIRQSFVYGWSYINYNEMNSLMKSHQTPSQFLVMTILLSLMQSEKQVRLERLSLLFSLSNLLFSLSNYSRKSAT